MKNVIKLDLKREGYRGFYYLYDSLYPYMKDLDIFLEKHSDMNSLCFSKKVLMGYEIQANNSIEGLKDDLEVINRVIHKLRGSISVEEKNRISNLYYGYQYILNQYPIDKIHLRKLYSILSKNLLDSYSYGHMGKFYRNGPVYIMNDKILSFKEAVSSDRVSYYMDDFFDFVHDDNAYSSVDVFLKSQIMHLYFVYVHPYFDVNGRTARTVSMWYLLNHHEYSMAVFNKAISYYRQKYIEYVDESCSSGNLTRFLQYMFVVVLKELEREVLINTISSYSEYRLDFIEKQVLEYYLMIHGKVTLKKLMAVYSYYNPRVSYQVIYCDRIYPLLEKKILFLDDDNVLHLNQDIYLDRENFKYLKLEKK